MDNNADQDKKPPTKAEIEDDLSCAVADAVGDANDFKAKYSRIEIGKDAPFALPFVVAFAWGRSMLGHTGDNFSIGIFVHDGTHVVSSIFPNYATKVKLATVAISFLVGFWILICTIEEAFL